MDIWEHADAEARFGDVVQRAQREGPQRISGGGREVAVVIGIEDWERLQPTTARKPLVAFLEGLGLHELDTERPFDNGRAEPSETCP